MPGRERSRGTAGPDPATWDLSGPPLTLGGRLASSGRSVDDTRGLPWAGTPLALNPSLRALHLTFAIMPSVDDKSVPQSLQLAAASL